MREMREMSMTCYMSNLNTHSDVTSTYVINHTMNQSRPLPMINIAVRLMLPKGKKLLNLTLKTRS